MHYRSATGFMFLILAIIFGVALLITKGEYWYFIATPIVIIVVALLALKVPIDRYFFRYQNVGFDDKIQDMLKVEYPIIADYSADQQKVFFKRLFYFMYERDCYVVKEDSDKLDLYHSLLICAPGVILSMEGKEDEARDVQRIAAYHHPFPSPKMKFLHAAEYDEEDGVIIISLEQMILSQRKPNTFFPINYYMWAERKLAVHEGFPEVPMGFIEKFEEIWGFTPKSVEGFLGYELRNLPAVAICAYVLRKERMKALFPSFFSEIKNYMSA